MGEENLSNIETPVKYIVYSVEIFNLAMRDFNDNYKSKNKYIFAFAFIVK